MRIVLGTFIMCFLSSSLNADMQVINDPGLGYYWGQAIGQGIENFCQQRQRVAWVQAEWAQQQYIQELAYQQKIREMKLAQEHRLQELARLQEQKQQDEQKRQEQKQQRQKERQERRLIIVILSLVVICAILGSLCFTRRKKN